MDRVAREKLARDNMSLVESIARKTKYKVGSFVDYDDLISFGMTGLADAIDRFEPNRKVPFGAFARQRIQGAIYDGMVDASWLPRRMVREIGFFRRADEMVAAEAQTPRPADRTEAVHRLADRLNEVMATYVITCADPQPNPRQDASPSVEGEAQQNQYYKLVNTYIEHLPQRERELIRMYYYESKPLKQIAKELGHTTSWASRVLKSSLTKLRDCFDDPPYQTEQSEHE